MRPEAQKLREMLIEETRKEVEGYADEDVCLATGSGVDATITLICMLICGVVPTLYVARIDDKSSDYQYTKRLSDTIGLKMVDVLLPNPLEDIDNLRESMRWVKTHWETLTDMFSKKQYFDDPAYFIIGWAIYNVAKKMVEDGRKVVGTGAGSDSLFVSSISMGRAFWFMWELIRPMKGWICAPQDWNMAKSFLDKTLKAGMDGAWNVWKAFDIKEFSPFHSHEVREFASNLPQEVIWGGPGMPKALLEEAFRSELPEFIIDRDKEYFSHPLKSQKFIEAFERVLKEPEFSEWLLMRGNIKQIKTLFLRMGLSY